MGLIVDYVDVDFLWFENFDIDILFILEVFVVIWEVI